MRIAADDLLATLLLLAVLAAVYYSVTASRLSLMIMNFKFSSATVASLEMNKYL